MNPDNTKKLYEAFPRLYRGRTKSAHESAMYFGFECQDGWFNLIWKLSEDIEEIARQQGLEPYSNEWPEATQVKEKLGTLRFHLKNYHEASSALIAKAAEASEAICELCGAPSQHVPLRKKAPI